VAGVSCLAFFFDVSAAFESIGTDRVPIFDRPVSGRETLSQLVFVLALHFVQHLPPSLPFSVLALSLLRISIIPDPTGSPWMPMTVRGCVPLCMYLDNENAFTAFFFDVSAAFESIGTDTSRWPSAMCVPHGVPYRTMPCCKAAGNDGAK